jgi:hypothetical protein
MPALQRDLQVVFALLAWVILNHTFVQKAFTVRQEGKYKSPARQATSVLRDHTNLRNVAQEPCVQTELTTTKPFYLLVS